MILSSSVASVTLTLLLEMQIYATLCLLSLLADNLTLAVQDNLPPEGKWHAWYPDLSVI